MTGLGERAHLLSRDVDLETHITDILGIIEAEELDEVILCGHSYGGLVITGVADRMAGRLASLVYLDAYIPETGQSRRAMVSPERHAETEALVAAEGEGWWIPVRSAENFEVRDAADRDWVNRRCTPHPFATMSKPIHLTGAWQSVAAKAYILAAGYSASSFGPYAERAKADGDWKYFEVDCPHDVMVDEPAALSKILMQLAE